MLNIVDTLESRVYLRIKTLFNAHIQVSRWSKSSFWEKCQEIMLINCSCNLDDYRYIYVRIPISYSNRNLSPFDRSDKYFSNHIDCKMCIIHVGIIGDQWSWLRVQNIILMQFPFVDQSFFISDNDFVTVIAGERWQYVHYDDSLWRKNKELRCKRVSRCL